MTIQCCVCKKVRVEDAWKRQAAPPEAEVSHTYCPACRDRTMNTLKAEQQVAPLAV